MLRLPRFELLSPRTVRDAAAMLRDSPGSMLVAGGTDLFPKMKRRQQQPPIVISLGRIPDLRGVARADDGLHIRAMTTLTALASDASLDGPYRALREAAASISTPQLRNAGTIGGNLCLDTRCNWYDQSLFWRQAMGYCMKTHADVVCRVATSSPRCLATASADTVPALLALDARVHVTGPDGDREIALADMYREDGIHYMTLARHDVVTGVSVPDRAGWVSTYVKLRDRLAFDFPIAGVAIALKLNGGVVEDARIAVTGLGSRASLVPAAAESLIGRTLDEATVSAAAAATQRASRPMDNTAGTMAARRIAVKVMTERALRQLTTRN
jgi:4-hydroxybenzoyl-CoA reductase subunit beta